jgi:predicted nucleic acid-binding protein
MNERDAESLTDAKEAQLVPSVGELLQQMRGAGYWIHDTIVEAAMRAAKE